MSYSHAACVTKSGELYVWGMKTHLAPKLVEVFKEDSNEPEVSYTSLDSSIQAAIILIDPLIPFFLSSFSIDGGICDYGYEFHCCHECCR